MAHMIACRGIRPAEILTLTFNKEAAGHGRAVPAAFRQPSLLPRFQTIHSFCYRVVMNKCRRDRLRPPRLLETVLGQKVNRLFVELFRKYQGLSPTQEEIEDVRQAIGYVKNMMLEEDQVRELSVCDHFWEIYQGYERYKRRLG